MKIKFDGSALLQYTPVTSGSAIAEEKRIAKEYEYKETREIVQLVTDAEDLIHIKGEAAFSDFRTPGSRWRQDETYIFILDIEGRMLLHPDPAMEGKDQLDLKDINGKPIIRGLIETVTSLPGKPEGWFHYQWPVPGGLLPRWKSSYVRLVIAPSNKKYIVGSGMYNDRMEKEFVVDIVKAAVGKIEMIGEAAFQLFHDPTGPFIAKDAYVFVMDEKGIELVNPAFPNLEGNNILDVKDTNGKQLVREMVRVVQTSGSGWVDYMWPKPGESISTQKSAYVSKAKFGKQWVLVGCGVYLADAPKEIITTRKMTASELMTLVREAAAVFEKLGEKAYPEFNTKGTKWYHDDTYFFVWTMDGIRAFNGPEPEKEGADLSQYKDILARPVGQMILEAGRSESGEGWIHYMYIVPGDIFPKWKSSFVKKVTFPSGKQHVIGCGIYNMQMDKAFVEDVVNHASLLIEKQGEKAFARLRDKKGPFFFMDTYVFVQNPAGTELVNPAQPNLEGRNIIDLKDMKGKAIVRDEIAAAMTDGSAWLECYWFKPGDNKPALKQTFVRKVKHGDEIYIVGSGLYSEEGPTLTNEIQKISWQATREEKLSDKLSRRMISGKMGTLAKLSMKNGADIARHYHVNEEYVVIISGALKYKFDDREVLIGEDETILVPSNVPHSIVALKDTVFIIFFAPVREDWLHGEDQYLRK